MKIDSGLLAILSGTVATATLVQTLPARALTGEEVSNISREYTVLITRLDEDGNVQENGSGVIVSRNGDVYYVLTCDHVVDEPGSYGIMTHDGEGYGLAKDENDEDRYTPLANGLDLAIVEFESDEDYPVATLSTARVSEGIPVFVSGWPEPGTIGAQANSIIRQFSDGRVSSVLNQPIETGYQIGYTSTTRVGMSGGPVVDAGGRVIAIHGQADVASIATNPGLESSEANSLLNNLAISTGYNYGIPIQSFLEAAPETGLYLNLQVDNSPSPELGAPYVASATPDDRDVIRDFDRVTDDIGKALGILGAICGIFGC